MGISSPQNDVSERNTALTATLSIDRLFVRDTLGLEVRANVSWLRPLQVDLMPYQSVTNSLVGRWSRDFTPNWNSLITAGIEQVYTDTGSKPLALLPTGSASVRYTLSNLIPALDFTPGTATNLQVGSVTVTDKITARGIFTLDPRELRALTFSAGILHNEPLGEVAAAVAAGTGNAVQGDAGFTTAISRKPPWRRRATASRTSSIRAATWRRSLAHIFFVGVTAVFKNTERPTRALPSHGRRVDQSDAEGFPVVEDEPTP